MFKDKELEASFKEHATLMQFKEGTVIMEPGHYIKFIPIVVKGCIRVLRQDKLGHEAFLYHLMPGETCALSLTCCSTLAPSEVKTIAEEDTEVWAIPVQYVEEWQNYKEWKDFIGLTYQTRFNKLLKAIDDISFEHMDERLWKYLVARARAKDNLIIHAGHDEIAQELNIQRETVTRLLKKLKDNGFIETGRNMIHIMKKDALM
ncbi:MAG: Crp/Fnr family transcriptional regulator [Bacteroidia bacterium]